MPGTDKATQRHAGSGLKEDRSEKELQEEQDMFAEPQVEPTVRYESSQPPQLDDSSDADEVWEVDEDEEVQNGSGTDSKSCQNSDLITQYQHKSDDN